MPDLVRHVPSLEPDAPSAGRSPRNVPREWLVTNGLGGYASGTIEGQATRRYHGLLIAALPVPRGRWLLLSHLSERVRLPNGDVASLGGELPDGRAALRAHTTFRLELGLPVWEYTLPGVTLEKRVMMVHTQNSTCVRYRLLEGDGPVRLKLLPSVHSRPHDAPVHEPLPGRFRLTELDGRYEVSASDLPTLRLQAFGGRQAFTVERREILEVLFPTEEERGYEHEGSLWSPGYFRVDLRRDTPAAFLASSEEWDVIDALAPDRIIAAEHERRQRLLATAHPEAQTGVAAELVLAADQFVIRPSGRTAEAARARAEGDDVRSVIAGYHWFTDWGRDTMISLEGLTLTTGRHAEAGYILRTFAHYIRDGLIPNLFPEGDSEGLYHTADATLWLFHAVDRYMAATDDEPTLEWLRPRLTDVVTHHLAGTRFGIGVDRDDHLLRQGQAGYQLTWMDAKVGDWVVTPRRGKAVEINALWYNALRLLADWNRRLGQPADADRWEAEAQAVHASFNRRFWNGSRGHLYDVVDGESGDDPACRPNQLFAISLSHPVLDPSRWGAVLDVVADQLVTPVGLRSLSADHPDYKPLYFGDITARDAAYHQGTIWAWLIGPFIDAWLRVHADDRVRARQWLRGFDAHLGEACIGSISEVFDAAAPYRPRGCVAQAWSVAEVLRCWVKTADAPVADHASTRAAAHR